MSDESERVSFVDPQRLASLPRSSLTVSGFYDDASYSPWDRVDGKTVRVAVSVPATRWQAFKDRHRESWWLGWFVRWRPVRRSVQFQGYAKVTVEPMGDADTPE